MDYFNRQNLGNLSFLSNPLTLLPQKFPKVDLSKVIDFSKFMKQEQIVPSYSTEIPRQRYDNFLLDSRLARLDSLISRGHSGLNLAEKREQPVYSSEKPSVNYDDKNRIRILSYSRNFNYSLSA